MNADINFEKMKHHINKNKMMKKKKDYIRYILESKIDDYVGFFVSPSKAVDFVNKRYNKSCYKKNISKKCFAIHEKYSNKFVGFIYPAKSYSKILGEKK